MAEATLNLMDYDSYASAEDVRNFWKNYDAKFYGESYFYWGGFAGAPPKSESPPPTPAPAPANSNVDVCEKLILAGFRTLALKNHPDHGGDARAFKAVRTARNHLLGLIGRPRK